MGIAVDDLVIVECTWFALVCITAQVTGIDILGQKAPLDARREACATATAQTSFFDNVNNVGGGLFCDGNAERLVAFMLDVDIEVRNVGYVIITHDDVFGNWWHK